MIKNNHYANVNKNWEIGAVVNIGFMKNLRVYKVSQIKDGMPDIYTLISPKGKFYEFIPHNGLYAI